MRARRVFSLAGAAHAARGALIADNPHSGRDYPADFGAACRRADLRQAEDAFLDRLLDFLPRMGVPLLTAHVARAYIDLNRRDDVSARYFRVRYPARAPYGLKDAGLIRALNTRRHRVPVYARTVSLAEAFARVARVFRPYHHALRQLAEQTHAAAGRVVHLNMHSMPSRLRRGRVENRYDIILGTRRGSTADRAFVRPLKELFAAAGYRVGVNVRGFSGQEIVRRTGQPARGLHSIQIEINRRLYLDEKNLRLRPAAARKLKKDLKRVVAAYKALLPSL